MDEKYLIDLLRRAQPHLFAVDKRAWCWCDITVPGSTHDLDCRWVWDVDRVGAIRMEIQRVLERADES